jgi:hypothetical protein
VLIYNIPAAALNEYQDKTITIRSDDARRLAQAFSTAHRDNLSSLQVLSLDCDADVLLHLSGSAAIDLVVDDPTADFGRLHRFSALPQRHWVRATVRAVPGMTKAVKIAQALNFSVKLNINQPEAPVVDEFVALAEYYLRGSAVTSPIEPFHSLFLSFLSDKPTSLWSLQEEDPAVDRYVTDDGQVTFSKRLVLLGIPEDQFVGFLEQRMSARLAAEECAECKFFSRCRGFFKLPVKDYQCDRVKRLFSLLHEAAGEMKQDEERFVEIHGPSTRHDTTSAALRKGSPCDAAACERTAGVAEQDVLSSFSMQRLNYRLEEFVRHSWASNEAQDTWEPRIGKIVNCLHDLEWRSILEGLRACALTSVPPDELEFFAAMLATHGLTIASLEKVAVQDTYTNSFKTPQEGEPFHYWCAIGRAPDVQLFEAAYVEHDDGAIGRLLGYPKCCIDFFNKVWVDERFIDTTWPQAQNTAAKKSITPTHIEISGSPSCNQLLRWLGPRLAIHLPCSFDCQPTIDLTNKLIEVARSAGFHGEMDWMEEMLSWPVDWIALNGLAEITTPVGTVSTVTDATVEMYRVSYIGTGYGRARGVGQSRSSAGFQPAIGRMTKPPDESLDEPFRDLTWYYADNGFNSKEGMDLCHDPIVKLATETLSQATGNVLDLGCGNGVLLKKICRSHGNVIPWGIDHSTANIGHARWLSPRFADNFVVSDIFDDCVVWSQDCEFQLVILSLIHLYQVPEEYAEELLRRIKEHTRNILLYAYAGSDVSLEELAQKAEITLSDKQSSNDVAIAILRKA